MARRNAARKVQCPPILAIPIQLLSIQNIPESSSARFWSWWIPSTPTPTPTIDQWQRFCVGQFLTPSVDRRRRRRWTLLNRSFVKPRRKIVVKIVFERKTPKHCSSETPKFENTEALKQLKAQSELVVAKKKKSRGEISFFCQPIQHYQNSAQDIFGEYFTKFAV